MVTVIASKEELTTPANNGVNHAYANEHERTFQFIKDYQEVNFHRTASCKPLPEDLFGTVDGQPPKTSIEGTFFVQIDAIQPIIPMSKDQKAQTHASNHLVLSLTDGIMNVQAVTSDSIPNLSLNTKIGSKLLLTETILVQNGILQLTPENTRFQNGSSTYPRPRQPYRGRGNGPYRPSYDGRRNPRYENEDGETTFRKGPPPKTTLMDFMTTLKISNTDESDKVKERPEKRRYHNNDSNNNGSSNTVTNNAHYANHQAMNNNYPTDQIVFQQEGVDEAEDLEDDPMHANHRERRNPLPPRLQRAQEERSRRSTSRFYEEGLYGTDLNGVYATDPISGQPLSTVTYGHDPSYLHANPAVGQQHNPYAQGVNGSIPGHLAYYPANPNSMPYNLAAMPNSTYSNQQPLLGHSYPNEHLAFCYGAPYGVPAYLPAVNGDSKVDGNSCPENDSTMNAGSQNDENNDSGIKSESSSTEQKQTPPPANEHGGNPSSEKRREGKPNQRIRWKVGDICQARWSEDGKFYPASVASIQPPYATVMFLEYYTYESVHFADMKAVAHDQPIYPYVPPMADLNVLAANGYYAPRSAFYPATMDGCVLMPEAPPFPFNSAGTLYMYPPPVAPHQRPVRYNGNGPAAQATRRNENGDGTLDSASPPSKDSNDASVISSMTASSNDDNQQQDLSLPRPCSIADAPLTLVTSDDLHEQSSSGSAASSPSSKCDEEGKRCEGDDEEEPKKKRQQQPENN